MDIYATLLAAKRGQYASGPLTEAEKKSAEVLKSEWMVTQDEEAALSLSSRSLADCFGEDAIFVRKLLYTRILLRLLYGSDLSKLWIRLPNTNPVFSGATPLELLASRESSSIDEIQRLLILRSG